MTIKEAFEKLAESVKKGMKNPFFVMRSLSQNFADVADEIDDTGTYSTTEHVVGKWINGKTIYEKTVNFGTLPNTETSQKSHGISNIDQIVGVEGIAINDTNVSINLPYASPGETKANTSLIVNRTVILITTENNRTNYTGYITLRYTKSST